MHINPLYLDYKFPPYIEGDEVRNALRRADRSIWRLFALVWIAVKTKMLRDGENGFEDGQRICRNSSKTELLV